MSDPLSITGGIVGVASLGIQVCQSLASYLRSVKGRRKEIADDLREVQALIGTFYSLNDILPKLDQTPSVNSAAIRQCLRDSTHGLQELQEQLLELRGPEISTDVKGKVVEAGRSLVYPLHEGKLTSLHRKLQGLLGNLRLAIGTVSL